MHLVWNCTNVWSVIRCHHCGPAKPLPVHLSNVAGTAQLALELVGFGWVGLVRVEENLEKRCPNLCAPLGMKQRLSMGLSSS